MPPRKRARTTRVPRRSRRYGPRRRRRYRRRYRRLPVGMPAKQVVKLKYATTINLDPAAGSVTSHYFSANGMFDPDVSGVGHQPLYFDQYMANYDHFTVLGSAIRVTATPVSSTAGTPCMWGVMMDDNNTLSYTTPSEIIESNQGKNYWRQGTYGIGSTNTMGRGPVIIRKYSAKRAFGKITDKLTGNVASNPADGYFYAIWAGSPDGLSDPTGVQLLVEISYIALLTEPKYIAQS